MGSRFARRTSFYDEVLREMQRGEAKEPRAAA
jgi:hypothetical protein